MTHVFAFSTLLFDKYLDSEGYVIPLNEVILESMEGKYKSKLK